MPTGRQFKRRKPPQIPEEPYVRMSMPPGRPFKRRKPPESPGEPYVRIPTPPGGRPFKHRRPPESPQKPHTKIPSPPERSFKQPEPADCSCECDPNATLQPRMAKCVPVQPRYSQPGCICPFTTEVVVSSPPNGRVIKLNHTLNLKSLNGGNNFSNASAASLFAQIADAISAAQDQKCVNVHESSSAGAQTYIEEASQACPNHFLVSIPFHEVKSHSKVWFPKNPILKSISKSNPPVPPKEVQTNSTVKTQTAQTTIARVSSTQADEESSPGPSQFKVNALYKKSSGHFNTPNNSSTTVISSQNDCRIFSKNAQKSITDCELKSFPLYPATYSTAIPPRLSQPDDQQPSPSKQSSKSGISGIPFPLRPETSQNTPAKEPPNSNWEDILPLEKIAPVKSQEKHLPFPESLIRPETTAKQPTPASHSDKSPHRPEYQQRSLLQCVPWPELNWFPVNGIRPAGLKFHQPVKEFPLECEDLGNMPCEYQPRVNFCQIDNQYDSSEHWRPTLPNFKLPAVPWHPRNSTFPIKNGPGNCFIFENRKTKTHDYSNSRDDKLIFGFQNTQNPCSIDNEMLKYPRRRPITSERLVSFPRFVGKNPPTGESEQISNEDPKAKLYKLTQDLYNLVANDIRNVSMDEIEDKLKLEMRAKEITRATISEANSRSISSTGNKVNIGVNACEKRECSGLKLVFHDKNSVTISDVGKIKNKSSIKRTRSKKSLAHSDEPNRKKGHNSKKGRKKKVKIDV